MSHSRKSTKKTVEHYSEICIFNYTYIYMFNAKYTIYLSMGLSNKEFSALPQRFTIFQLTVLFLRPKTSLFEISLTGSTLLSTAAATGH